MPPRLLDKPVEEYGPPPSMVSEHFGFVDTLQEYPTFWSFDSGGLKTLSNQYAAMPSLHMAWAVWSMLVLLPLVRRGWLRALIVLDPLATFFCIVVTANHYWLDALMGVATLAVGYRDRQPRHGLVGRPASMGSEACTSGTERTGRPWYPVRATTRSRPSGHRVTRTSALFRRVAARLHPQPRNGRSAGCHRAGAFDGVLHVRTLSAARGTATRSSGRRPSRHRDGQPTSCASTQSPASACSTETGTEAASARAASSAARRSSWSGQTNDRKVNEPFSVVASIGSRSQPDRSATTAAMSRCGSGST